MGLAHSIERSNLMAKKTRPWPATNYPGPCYMRIIYADWGNAFSNGGSPADPSGCNMVCIGNYSEYCGGSSLLNVYEFGNSFTPPTSATTTTSSATSTTTTTTSSTPSNTPKSNVWTSLGCYTYVLLPHLRVFPNMLPGIRRVVHFLIK